MNFVNYYWYFQGVLTPKFCDEVIKFGNSQKELLANTGNFQHKLDKKIPLSKKDIKDLKKKRDSNVAWLNDRWIYREIFPYVHMANKNAGWNFQWDWAESCQFTKYKKGQFYDWHCDSWDKPYGNKEDVNKFNKIRKLSVTCSLSDPKKYKGGELEFDFRNRDPKIISKKVCTEIMPRGSIVVFPSHVWHRVKPVNKGERYSLVIWNLGNPFK